MVVDTALFDAGETRRPLSVLRSHLLSASDHPETVTVTEADTLVAADYVLSRKLSSVPLSAGDNLCPSVPEHGRFVIVCSVTRPANSCAAIGIS